MRKADGTLRLAYKRGFLTKTAGLDWLHDQQAAGRKGEYVEPGKRKIGPYGGTDVIPGGTLSLGRSANLKAGPARSSFAALIPRTATATAMLAKGSLPVDDHEISQACAHVTPQVLAYACFT